MTKKEYKISDFNPFYMLSVFWIGLGAVLCFAGIYPETLKGKITNVIAGLILIGLGLFAYWRGRISDREKS